MPVAEVRVELKKGVADPEGQNTRKTLELLGLEGLENVRSVKVFDLEFSGDEGRARQLAEQACRRLLANPVIHDYTITIR